MRTDIKIGIAVGLFVAVVTLVYFLVAGGGGTDVKSKPAELARKERPRPGEHNQPEGASAEQSSGAGRTTDGDATSGTGDIAIGATGDTVTIPYKEPTAGDTGRTAGSTGGAGTSAELADVGKGAELADAGKGAELADAGKGAELADAGKGAELADAWADESIKVGYEPSIHGPKEVQPTKIEPTPGPKIEPVPVPKVEPRLSWPVAATSGRIYIVKQGDQGFWGIAAKEYGHGKHYTLIAGANPQADSNALRPGQELRLPALPAETPVGPAPVEVAAYPVAPSGTRLYIVQEGDAGFWGVSQKVYGYGKYFYMIARANPQADTNKLKPGQRLVIPSRVVKPRAFGIGLATTDTPPPSLPDARGTYVVQQGDAGFWDVAKKRYGDGRYWPVIASANPNADTRRLRPGQRLKVPILTEEIKRAGRLRIPATPAGPERRAVPAGPPARDRPFFTEYASQ